MWTHQFPFANVKVNAYLIEYFSYMICLTGILIISDNDFTFFNES